MSKSPAKPKSPQTSSELDEQLAAQIGMLKASADGFDRGDTFEYRRIALAIRILVHDTHVSHSLLGQLGRKTIDFTDTADSFQSGNQLAESVLTVTVAGGARSGFQAPLDGAPIKRRLPFDSWWNADVIKDSKGRLFTRRDLVLTAANQDGGAHVGDMEETYAELLRRETTGWWRETDEGTEPLGKLECAAIRQIGHEMIKTLDADYEKQPEYTGSVLMSAFYEGAPGNDVVFFTSDDGSIISSGSSPSPQWVRSLAKARPAAPYSPADMERSTSEREAMKLAAFEEPVGRRAKRRAARRSRKGCS
jgi:hypothetical protein